MDLDMDEREAGWSVQDFWKEELLDLFNDQVRVHAVDHSHLIARKVGVDGVLEMLEEHLLPVEICDSVWVALGRSLGEPEFAQSMRAKRLLHWLLENPEKRVREVAVQSVLKQAHLDSGLVGIRGGYKLRPVPNANFENDSELNIEMGNASIDTDTTLGISGGNQSKPGGEPAPLLLVLCDMADFPGFFQRISACEILSSDVPSGLTKDQEEDLISQLAGDPVPMVRQAIARALGEMAAKQGARADLVPLEVTKNLMNDPCDIVQAAGIFHCLGPFIRRLSNEERQQPFLNFLREDIVHSSKWRAREAVAQRVDVLFEELGGASSGAMDIDNSKNSSSTKELQMVLVELFTDHEPKVRAAMASHIHYFTSHEFGHMLDTLVHDEEPAVRRATIAKLPVLAKKNGSEVTRILNNIIVQDMDPGIRTFMVKTFFTTDLCALLSDADRLTIVRRIYSTSTMEETRNLTVFSWRTINEATKAIPVVTKLMPVNIWQTEAGGLSFFSKCLRDSVYTIQATAVSHIGSLAKAYGADWIRTFISPMIVELYENDGQDYKLRICALSGMYELYRIGCMTDAMKHLVLQASANDPVGNVRVKAKTLFQNVNI